MPAVMRGMLFTCWSNGNAKVRQGSVHIFPEFLCLTAKYILDSVFLTTICNHIINSGIDRYCTNLAGTCLDATMKTSILQIDCYFGIFRNPKTAVAHDQQHLDHVIFFIFPENFHLIICKRHSVLVIVLCIDSHMYRVIFITQFINFSVSVHLMHQRHDQFFAGMFQRAGINDVLQILMAQIGKYFIVYGRTVFICSPGGIF